jgi:hypothetical protein
LTRPFDKPELRHLRPHLILAPAQEDRDLLDIVAVPNRIGQVFDIEADPGPVRVRWLALVTSGVHARLNATGLFGLRPLPLFDFPPKRLKPAPSFSTLACVWNSDRAKPALTLR